MDPEGREHCKSSNHIYTHFFNCLFVSITDKRVERLAQGKEVQVCGDLNR